MEIDGEVTIQRVANGYIVRPSHHFDPARGHMMSNDREDVFIFETFESLTTWLSYHFTQPVAEGRQ
jgi:hypothetical protein